jgi:hypothetical protein
MTTVSKQHRDPNKIAPGFLLAPLDWVIERPEKAIETEPTLLGPLFDLGQTRMHLAALALAHLNQAVSLDLALLLLRGPIRDILDFSLGHHPSGLERALAHLPPKVLEAESYRKLAELLADRTTARFLHHAKSIDEALITGLHKLPTELRRPAILAMFGRVEGMAQFIDGLQCLAARAGLPFEQLASEIGALDQPEQVVSKIKELTENLPLIGDLPPAKIGPYRRLDSLAEIRTLAKDWQNCLAGCLHNINDATGAIYRTDLPDQQAVCLVYRQWRLGWFLVQAKGPRNIDLEPQQLEQTYNVFAHAGVLQASIIEAIKIMVLTNNWSRRDTLDEEY